MRYFYNITIPILLQLLLLTSVSGQSFVNPYKAIHSSNLNQEYINKRVGQLSKEDSLFFAEGYIVNGGRRVSAAIYVTSHKADDDSYLFLLIRGSGDSIYVLTPRDIDGYSVNGVTMRSHRSISSDTNYFFIKQVDTGKVSLFSRGAVPSDEQLVYYFKKKEEPNLLYYTPYKSNEYYTQEWDVNGKPMLSKYSRPNEGQFVAIFSQYFKDCLSVRNKIIEKFYTSTDLELIVKEYNRCRE